MCVDLYFCGGAEGLIYGGGYALGRAGIANYVDIRLRDAVAQRFNDILAGTETCSQKQIIAGEGESFSCGGIEAANSAGQNLIEANIEEDFYA